MRKLVKVPEAAELLSVSEKKIWQLIYSRQVAVVRIGRSVRLTTQSLTELVESGMTPAKLA